eukprot:7876610-Pyramimonas_sp.AAC.1
MVESNVRVQHMPRSRINNTDKQHGHLTVTDLQHVQRPPGGSGRAGTVTVELVEVHRLRPSRG